MGSAEANARVRRSLQKCVAKIEKNQLKDGSWNIAGGWAPILGTSMASRSLFMAQQKGVQVSDGAMLKVEEYTQRAGAAAPPSGRGWQAAVRRRSRTSRTDGGKTVTAASAGVSLYQARAGARTAYAAPIRIGLGTAIRSRRSRASSPDAQFVNGFGSFGGEEFFSYLNISDSLHRTRRTRMGRSGIGDQGQDAQTAERGRDLGRTPLHHWPRRGNECRHPDVDRLTASRSACSTNTKKN